MQQTGPVSSRLKVVFADLGYESGPLAQLMEEVWGARLELKKHPWQGAQPVHVQEGQEPPPRPEKPKGFVLLPKRWIVERTIAWISRCRRHAKDYEGIPKNSEAHIRVSMIRLMLKRMDESAA